jgi:OmpA-OmpF porin, OOP family
VPKAAPAPTKSAIVTAEGTWIFKGVQFETNSAELKTSSYPVLDEIVAGMKEQPDLRVEIQGHTDSRGSKALNDRLSQQRAESVMAYLVSKGIARDRLTARGYGPDKPVASNDTVEGRAENRRVELKPLK